MKANNLIHVIANCYLQLYVVPRSGRALDGSGADNVRPHVHLQSFRSIHSGWLSLIIFHRDWQLTRLDSVSGRYVHVDLAHTSRFGSYDR